MPKMKTLQTEICLQLSGTLEGFLTLNTTLYYRLTCKLAIMLFVTISYIKKVSCANIDI